MFKELHRKHADHVNTSRLLYLVTIFITWFSAFFILGNAQAALTATILVWLAMHVSRIVKLVRVPDLALTKGQYVLAAAMALCIILFIAFSYWQIPASGPVELFGISKQVLLSLAIAALFLTYVDFAIASFLNRTNSSNHSIR